MAFPRSRDGEEGTELASRPQEPLPPRPSAVTFGPVGLRLRLFGPHRLNPLDDDDDDDAPKIKFWLRHCIRPNLISTGQLFRWPSAKGSDGLTMVSRVAVTNSCTDICGTLKAALNMHLLRCSVLLSVTTTSLHLIFA